MTYPNGRHVRRRYKSAEVREQARNQMWTHGGVTFEVDRGGTQSRSYIWPHIAEAAARR